MEIGARHGNLFRRLVAVAATLSVVLILSAQTKVQPSSHITAIDTRTGVVSAKVNASGADFQFTLSKPALLSTLKIGQGVYANFQTKEISLNGKDVVGSVVRVGPPEGPPRPAAPNKSSNVRPPPQPQMSPKASGGSASAGAVSSAAGTSPACCGITSVNAQERVAVAKVNSTGQVFEFSVPNSVPIQNLHAGQPVWANFKTMQVSLNGQTACCRIVSGSPQQASKPGLRAPATGAAPGVGAAGSGSAISAPASAGQPKTEAAPVTPGGLAGLKQAGPTINLPAPPQIQNFGVFPGPIPGGETDVGQVVLTGVPPSGATVQLSSDQPSVALVPAQIQVSGSGPSAGSAVIVVNTSPVTQPTDVTLSAEVAGSSDVRTTKLTVRPPQLSILQCSPSSVISGTPIGCKVWLDGPAPAAVGGGKAGRPTTMLKAAVRVQVTSSNPAVAAIPGDTIPVPAGATSADFQVPTTAYPEPVDVAISASFGDSLPKSASVQLTPAAIRSFTCSGIAGSQASSCDAFGGAAFWGLTRYGIGTVSTGIGIVPIALQFSGPTPEGFVPVTSDSGVVLPCRGTYCTPDNASLCYPASSVAYPLQAGQESGTWYALVNPVAVRTVATLSAQDPLSGTVKKVQVNVLPPTPHSLYFVAPDGSFQSSGSLSNVLVGGQQATMILILTASAPPEGITFDVTCTGVDAAGNALQGAITCPSQITATSAEYNHEFSVTVQPCEVNSPCKLNVSVGGPSATIYVNP